MSSAIGDNRTDQRNLPGLDDETGSEANQPTEMHLGCTFDEGGKQSVPARLIAKVENK